MKRDKSSPSFTRREFLESSLGSMALLTAASAGMPARAQAPTGTKGTLRYWDIVDPKVAGPRSEALRLIQESYTKKTGIGFNTEVMPYVQIEPNMIQAGAAGKTPDVVRIAAQALALHVHAGNIISLNELAAGMPKDDWLIPWDSHVYNGRKMGIPVENRVNRLVYRKDYLDAAGVKVPVSLDELGKAGKAATTSRTFGFLWGVSKANRAAGFAETFVSLIWGAGGEPFDANGRAAFNSPAGERVFVWMRDMVTKYNAMPKEAVAYDYDKMVDGMKAGTIAMSPWGTHRVVVTRKAGKLGDNLQTAALPGFEASKPCPAHTFGWVYAIGKDCKQPEVAWSFIEHAVSQEAQTINARLAGEIPSRKSTFNDPWFKTPEAAELVSWKDEIERNGRSLKTPEKYISAMEYLCEEAAEVILNNKSPKLALDDAAKKYNALIT